MKNLRITVGLLWCVSLPAADLARLRQLDDGKRVFELRSELERSGSTAAGLLYYRAVVASRSGNDALGIRQLRQYLATRPDGDMERKAHEELAAALVRTGHYKEAANQLAAAVRLTAHDDGERADLENSRVLYESLAHVPPLEVRFGPALSINARRNVLTSWDIPVELNGRGAEWIFDTGANHSTLTESEARRLGLTIRKTRAYVNGSTARKNSLNLAVAKDLAIGSARLHNVVFLVLPDESLYIAPLQYQIRGILGFPEIRGLNSFEFSAGGVVRIAGQSGTLQEPPNMFLDGLTPFIEVHHTGHSVQMFLDTGANASFGYPSFREVLSDQEKAALKNKQETAGGAGGVVQRNVDSIPLLRLELAGRFVDLQNISVLAEKPAAAGRARDGVLGMDALRGGFQLDFRAMRFAIE